MNKLNHHRNMRLIKYVKIAGWSYSSFFLGRFETWFNGREVETGRQSGLATDPDKFPAGKGQFGNFFFLGLRVVHLESEFIPGRMRQF